MLVYESALSLIVPLRSSPVLLGCVVIVDSLIPFAPDAGSMVNQSSPSSDQSHVAAIVMLSSPPVTLVAGVPDVSFVWITTVS